MSIARAKLAAKVSRKVNSKSNGAQTETNAALSLMDQVSQESNAWCTQYKKLLTVFEETFDEQQVIIDKLLSLCHKQYKKLCQNGSYNNMFIFKRDPIVQQSHRDRFIL